jgi:hypothetical protein
VRILWQHPCNLKKMIHSGHYAIVGTRWPPIESRVRVDSSIYHTLREHRLALNPSDKSPELIEFLRLTIFPHGFHLSIDYFHGVS